MATTNASPEEFLAAREATGPAPVSLLRLIRGFRADPLERWTRIREEHGEVAHYRFGLSETFFVSSPEGARRVLQDNVANYTKEHPSYAMIRRVVGDGLLTSGGSFWLRQRRLAQPAFHRQRLAAMGERITAAARETSRSWAALAASGERFPMVQQMSRLTLRIVGDALFGTELAAQAAVVGRSWDVLNTQLVERFNQKRLLPPILPTRYDAAFRTARRTMFEVVDRMIAQRRERGAESDDLLSMLMSARDEDTGEGMSDRQLRDEVVTMLLAGHETTAAALSWAWALLDQHPEVDARLTGELDQVLGGRPPTTADLPRLTYTRHVIDEVLRLYPPVYILNRRVKENDVVCGHRVHQGGVVVLPPLILHRDPGSWDQPDAFLPDRWADAEAEKRRSRFAYLPFSSGPRQCIGNNFALMEAVLILATLAQSHRARLAEGYQLQPQYLVTLRPSEGLPMRLEPRTSLPGSEAGASNRS